MDGKDFAIAPYSLPEVRARATPKRDTQLRAAPAVATPLADDETARIPLPDEVPPGLDLSGLPESVLHSGAIETLIGQNEDLMARLKVNIRRCSALERQLIDSERSASDARRINSSLTSQIQILFEKESALRERADVAERARSGALSRLALLEGFHRRALKWAKPRLKRAARAEATLHERDAELADARAKLARASARLSEIEGGRARDQALLVESYESKLGEARAEAEKLRSERAYLKERSDRLDETRKRLSEAENASILLDRRRKEAERKLNEEVARIQTETIEYRREAKRLASELASTKDALTKSEAKRLNSAAQAARADDQFESLRAVWEDAQKRCDQLGARNDALARVNQELARKLRENREPERAAASAAIDDPDRAAAMEAARGESFERFDAILAELESGMSRGLAFVEGSRQASREPEANS